MIFLLVGILALGVGAVGFALPIEAMRRQEQKRRESAELRARLWRSRCQQFASERQQTRQLEHAFALPFAIHRPGEPLRLNPALEALEAGNPDLPIWLENLLREAYAQEPAQVQQEREITSEKGPTVYRLNAVAAEGGLGAVLWLSERTQEIILSQALGHTRERLELALESSHAGVWEWDLRDGKFFVSSRWLELAGLDREKEPVSFEGVVQALLPEDRERFVESFDHFLSGKNSGFSTEVRLQLPSGTIRWVLCQASARRRNEGVPFRVAASTIDITGRKEAEKQLLQSQDLLQQSNRSLSAANRRLIIASDQASQLATEAQAANEAKTRFLATASHEMRTPLNGILGFLPLLRESQTTTDQDHWIAGIQTGSESLLALINDFLDLSQIEAGKVELKPVDLDLRKLVREVVESLRGRAEQAGLELTMSSAHEKPLGVKADGNRVRQILVNLIGNAIKFTDDGSVEVKLSTKGATVGAEASRSICIDIIDTGCGIPEHERERIFAAFDRVGGAQTEGTGLGLTIARELARQMQGGLELVDSSPEGSTFRLSLKLPSASLQSTAPATKRKRAPDLSKELPLRILVVDDAMINREVMKASLRDFGYAPTMADSGEAMLEACQSDPFDLIFLDFRMPGMDGLEAARQLRKLSADFPSARAFVCGLTADAMLGDAQAAIDAGMDRYETKPIRMQQIEEVIREAATRLETHPAGGYAPPSPSP